MTVRGSLIALLFASALAAGCQQEQAASGQIKKSETNTTAATLGANDKVAAPKVELPSIFSPGTRAATPAQKIDFTAWAAQGTNDPALNEKTDFSERTLGMEVNKGLGAIGR